MSVPNPAVPRPTVTAKRPVVAAKPAAAADPTPSETPPAPEETKEPEDETEEEAPETKAAPRETPAPPAAAPLPPPPDPPPSPPPTTTNEVNHQVELERRTELQVIEHLSYLEMCPTQTVDVRQFGNYFALGEHAIRVLQHYISQGLVVHSWKHAAGRYSLTTAGAETLAALREKHR